LTARAAGPYKSRVPKDLAALLVEDGAVPVESMERALARQREAGGALDTALLEIGAIDEARLTAYLGRASELPPPPPSAWTATDARARRLFPPRVAERHGLAPFSVDGRELSLVATYPVDLGLLDEISFMLSLHLTAHVGPEYRVRELIHRLYGGPFPPRLAALATGGPPVPALPPGSPPARSAVGTTASEETTATAGVEEDFSSPTPESREAPQLPRLFEAGEEDPLAAALTQAVEAIELDILGDETEPSGSEEEGAEPASPLAEGAGGEPPAPGRLDRSAPPHWSLEEAQAALAAARHRDEVVLAALRYTRDFFDFAALFAVTRDAVVGHDALGTEEGTRELARSVALYASDPGVFHTVLETRGQYLGPVTREPGTEAVLRGLARGAPRTVLVFPVRMRERVVCLLYADNGEAPVSPRRLGDLLMLLSTLGPAFERVLRDQKKRAGGSGPSAPETWRTREPGRSPDAPAALEPDEPAPEPPPADETPVAFATSPVEEISASPPADSPVEAEAEIEEVPAVGAGSPSEEAPAVLEEPPPIAPSPPRMPAATPGPMDVDVTFDEVDEVDEASPAAASQGGGAGHPEDPQVLPGEPPMRVAPSLAVLAEQALDGDVARAAEAREALAHRRREPTVREATDKLRRALLSGIAVRSAPAARALGAMREVEAIPLLVQVLENADPMCAEAAAWALRAITAQPLGRDPRPWLLWWKENRGRGRAEWLFGALVHPDRETRAAAAAELTSIAPASPVAYSPDLPPEDREQAARDWAGWWAISGPAL